MPLCRLTRARFIAFAFLSCAFFGSLYLYNSQSQHLQQLSNNNAQLETRVAGCHKQLQSLHVQRQHDATALLHTQQQHSEHAQQLQRAFQQNVTTLTQQHSTQLLSYEQQLQLCAATEQRLSAFERRFEAHTTELQTCRATTRTQDQLLQQRKTHAAMLKQAHTTAVQKIAELTKEQQQLKASNKQLTLQLQQLQQQLQRVSDAANVLMSFSNNNGVVAQAGSTSSAVTPAYSPAVTEASVMPARASFPSPRISNAGHNHTASAAASNNLQVSFRLVAKRTPMCPAGNASHTYAGAQLQLLRISKMANQLPSYSAPVLNLTADADGIVRLQLPVGNDSMEQKYCLSLAEHSDSWRQFQLDRLDKARAAQAHSRNTPAAARSARYTRAAHLLSLYHELFALMQY